jgi:dienelactone hydrolase
MTYVPFTEDKEISRPYRVGYLESVKSYLAKLQDEAAEKRASFINPERLAQNPESYRRAYYEMLGAPLTEYESLKQIPVTCVEDTFVADTALCEIRRMRLAVLGDFTVYGILFLPHERAEDAPFVISQHGGAGTPEVCSDFFGDNNYNHQTMRLLQRGAVVFAPGLLLWNVEIFGDRYDRNRIDSDLKQVGSSITALEVFAIRRCIDYFVTQPYCNPDRIGMAGLSYGGFFTTLTTAADIRIKSAYASCSFIDAVKYNAFTDWTWKNSANTFLEAEIAALIAPRYICFDAGNQDQLFGSDSTKEEFVRLKTYFAAQNVEDHIFLKTFDGNHEMDPADDCMDFFFAHL